MNGKDQNQPGNCKNMEVIDIHESLGIIPLFLIPRQITTVEPNRYIPSSPRGRERRILMRQRLLSQIEGPKGGKKR